MCWFFVETKLQEYPTHHHPSKTPPPPVFCSSLNAHTTICGGKYIYTYAHKSTLNILVTQDMTFRHKLCSICSSNYTVIWVRKAAEEVPHCVESKMIVMQENMSLRCTCVGLLQRLDVSRKAATPSP